MKKPTKEEIAIARYWIGVNKDIKDRLIVRAAAKGSIIERIRLRIAVRDVRDALIASFKPKNIARFFAGLYWRWFIIRLSLKWIRQFNIGDEVVYKGHTYRLTQGVQAPLWDMSLGEIYVKGVHEKDMRKVRSLENMWGSFRSGYRFYMGNWFAIWMHDGVQPWMLRCNIWPMNWWREAEKKGIK